MPRDVSTSPDMTKAFLEDRRTLWIVSFLIGILFLATNLPWQLDDYDQAKQAYTSFEIVKEGHLFYQQTPHEKVATKPPLVGWISAVLFAATRSWDWAWRLPSILSAMAMSILLYRAANLIHGPMAGLIALSAFGLNLLTPRLASLVRTDMPLALVIFLIGLQIWIHIREKRPWEKRDRQLQFFLLTAAMLIKGPIVYAFLLPGLIVAAVCDRRNLFTKTATVTDRRYSFGWLAWWPWVASLGIFLIWAIGGILLQPDFFDQVVMREFIGRFGETVHRPQPIYFYLPHLFHKFAPWSLLMIGLAIVDLRAARWSFREALRRISPETLWLIFWSLGGLLVMSLIPSKRVDRIFPVIPPLCLLLAAQLAHALRTEPSREAVRVWSAVALAMSILFTGVYTLAKVVAGYRNHRNALVIFGNQVRAQAQEKHWRYEAMWGGDEGLLLYLRKLHFVPQDQAVMDWNRGNLDALVVPRRQAPDLMRHLHDAALSELKSAPQQQTPDRGYVLITR